MLIILFSHVGHTIKIFISIIWTMRNSTIYVSVSWLIYLLTKTFQLQRCKYGLEVWRPMCKWRERLFALEEKHTTKWLFLLDNLVLQDDPDVCYGSRDHDDGYLMKGRYHILTLEVTCSWKIWEIKWNKITPFKCCMFKSSWVLGSEAH